MAPATASAQEEASVERGRYLAMTAGCNDCHTAGYATAEGNIPEEEWLMGDSLGWRGPWGTTYAVNLRIRLSEMTEDEWAEYAKTFKTRPPMPWFNVHDMTEADIRSIHKYVTSFEDKGEPAPEYLPPDVEPEGPYIQFPAPPQ
jgi:mono/diheme cytochrome c family protein